MPQQTSSSDCLKQCFSKCGPQTTGVESHLRLVDTVDNKAIALQNENLLGAAGTQYCKHASQMSPVLTEAEDPWPHGKAAQSTLPTLVPDHALHIPILTPLEALLL